MSVNSIKRKLEFEPDEITAAEQEVLNLSSQLDRLKLQKPKERDARKALKKEKAEVRGKIKEALKRC